MRVLRSFAATAGLACVAGLLAAGSSTASIPHPDVVSEDPVGYTTWSSARETRNRGP